jgi:hypothetical protein
MGIYGLSSVIPEDKPVFLQRPLFKAMNLIEDVF